MKSLHLSLLLVFLATAVLPLAGEEKDEERSPGLPAEKSPGELAGAGENEEKPLFGFILRAGDGSSRLLAGPTVGLVFENENLRFHLGFLGAFDWLQYDSRNVRSKGARIDRAIVIAEGSVGEYLTWKVAADLLGIDTEHGLEEAWFSFAPDPACRVTGGLVKVPIGIEHSIPAEDLPLLGYDFPAYLYGRTDWGIQVDGELAEGLFSYCLTATAGEGSDLFGERRGEPQLSARIAIYPFRQVDWKIGGGPYEIPLLSGLFVSGGCLYTFGYRDVLDVANPFRNKLFLTSRLEGDNSFFYTFGYGVDAGPFRVIHEVVRGSIMDLEVPGSEPVDLENQITSWALSVHWMVTGEPYDTRLFHQRGGRGPGFPRSPFIGPDGAIAGCGAFELAFRYSNADIDREFFDLGFTDYDESSQEFRAVSAALSWYPIANIRFTLQLTRTIADQFPAAFRSHGRDTSVAFRLQLRF